MRIAMWSGPRNLSTAMMYAFGNRADFSVWDEPFYATYLARTKAEHPLAKETIAIDETDARIVAKRCIGPIPDGKPNFYMKHMPHHMVDDFPLEWAKSCMNVHLIRHPARVIASYAAKRHEVSLEDIGFLQQTYLFQILPGPVIDSADIRANPEKTLRALCGEIGLNFSPEMLTWPAGPKPYDGPWAPHWYGSVHKSTRFADAEGPLPALTGRDAELLQESLPHYDEMKRQVLAI